MKNKFREKEEGFLNLTLSREDMAGVVGTSTEGIIRMMSEFKKQRLIHTRTKRVGILSESRLKRIMHQC